MITIRREPDRIEEPAIHKKRRLNEDAFSERVFSTAVRSALESSEKGDQVPMESLVSRINAPANDPESISIANFTHILKTLCGEVSRLDSRQCGGLIQGVISFKWGAFMEDEDFINAYTNFFVVLISAIPKWWSEVANKLISEFVGSETHHHHSTLKYIFKVIPTSTNVVQRILVKHFPNKNNKKKCIVNYVKNLIQLTEYCSDLSFQTWCLIVENCIKLDVELQNELDEVDEVDEEEEDIDSQNESDGDSGESDDSELDSDSEMHLDEEVFHVENITDLSSKLDTVLSFLLKTTGRYVSKENFETSGIVMFNTLVSLFKSHILPTHYTRCVQYLLFHVSQQQPELMDSFVVTLIDFAFSFKETYERRIKSMQYIASYIARAKRFGKNQLVFVVSYLMGWLERYVKEREHEIDNGLGGMERFKFFYSVVQTLMYIYCFRYNDLKRNDEWECSLDRFFQRVIVSRFNPLKYCNETVVLIFAKMAQQEDLCYCFSIIESNKRERLNGVKGSANSNTVSFAARQEFLDIEAYFPFDPLMLKRCKAIVDENYVQWSSNDDSDSE